MKPNNYASKFFTFLCCVIAFFPLFSKAQVASTYSFSTNTGTYTPISGGTLVSGYNDDNQFYSGISIGFPFIYNDTSYTTFGLNVNGWIAFGTASATSNTPISSAGTNNHLISAFGADLVMKFKTTGTTAAGNATITGVINTNGIVVGARLSGAGINASAGRRIPKPR